MQNSESETKRNITEKAVPFAKLLAQKSTVLLSTTDVSEIQRPNVEVRGCPPTNSEGSEE